MITSDTKPILVSATRRQTGVRHFAPGEGRYPTIPYCQGQARGVRPGEAARLAQLAAGFAEVVDPRLLMNCESCAHVIERYPAWRPNHFPLMEAHLRWI